MMMLMMLMLLVPSDARSLVELVLSLLQMQPDQLSADTRRSHGRRMRRAEGGRTAAFRGVGRRDRRAAALLLRDSASDGVALTAGSPVPWATFFPASPSSRRRRLVFLLTILLFLV
jgi:hypothetical protein